MADVPSTLNSWSATASSNSPNDNTTIGAGLADNLQALQAVVRGDLASKGSDIASSANPDVAAVQGVYHDLTGTNTVTGLGSTATAGIWKILQADSTAIFKHNTALAMPGAVDYIATAGDVLGFMCEATNQWRCMFGSPFGVPAGAMMDFGGTTAPSGWLECNGTAVSRTTYARLYTAIGDTWGSGDGSTTFNLPNFRGRTKVGRGTGETTETVTASSANGFTVSSNNTKWVTGMEIVVSGITGFTTSVTDGTYYVYRVSATNIRLCSTLAIAQNATTGSMETVSGTGSAVFTDTLTARTVGEVGGEEGHAMSSTEQLSHTHTQNSHSHGGGYQSSGGSTLQGGGGSDLADTTTDGAVATNQNTGGNAAMNIMQPFGVVMTIIKT